MRKPLPIRVEWTATSYLASALHQRGLRFRKTARELPGHPHLVFPRWKTVLFVCSCYNYNHECPTPRTWTSHDAHTRAKELAVFTGVLSHRGWLVDTVWRCEVSEEVPIPPRILDMFDLSVSPAADG